MTTEGVISPLIYVGEEGLKEKINNLHIEHGHMHTKKVFDKLREVWYSPGMFNMTRYQIALCVPCTKYNVKQVIKGKNSTLMSTQSGRWLQLDYLGPLPASKSYRYILALVDNYNKGLTTIKMKSTGAEELCEALTNYFGENGLPEYVMIDGNCVSFRKVDKKLLDGLRVGIIRSNHRSESQGLVERKFRDLLIVILRLLDGEDYLSKWSDVLGKATFLINSSPCVSLGGFSPNELIFRKGPRFLSTLTPLEEPVGGGGRAKETFLQINKMHELIKDATFKQLLQRKAYFFPNEALKHGSIVFRKRMQFSRNMAPKLQQRVVECFSIERRVGTSMYLCKNVLDGSKKLLPIDQMIRSRLSLDDAKALMNKLDNN